MSFKIGFGEIFPQFARYIYCFFVKFLISASEDFFRAQFFYFGGGRIKFFGAYF